MSGASPFWSRRRAGHGSWRHRARLPALSPYTLPLRRVSADPAAAPEDPIERTADRALLILSLVLLAGCSNGKAPVDDTFSELAGLDAKSDKFSGKLTIVGSIGYDETQGPFSYKNKYDALKFAGDAGDQITVDVGSKNGDTVAWVLDNDFNILAHNDDHAGGTNSHIALKLPANASRTHYIVVRDMDETTIVPELGLDGLISYNKGCYIGQEIIARIHFRGHVAKQLRGLVLTDSSQSPAGTEELKSADGKNAGRVTSVCFSPKLQKMIALAFVRYDYLAEGTELTIGDQTAVVKNLPFIEK